MKNTDSHSHNNPDRAPAGPPDSVSVRPDETRAETTRRHRGHRAKWRRGRKQARADGKARHNAYGAVDLGTNNCRLLIATHQNDGFRVIDAFSRVVGLGEGLEQSGTFDDAAMTRAIDALHVCADKLKRRRVGLLRAVATEACRLAENRGEFVDRVREETGLALDIISPGEEARLALKGCQPLFQPGYKGVVVFDIGGGSTEIVAARLNEQGEPQMVGWRSLPIGVIRLSDMMTEALDATQFDDVSARISEQVENFLDSLGWADDVRAGKVQMLGSSGTVTTMASHLLGLVVYDRRKVDGATVSRAKMREESRAVAIMDESGRAAIPCIGAERSRLIVPGCAILDGLLAPWELDEIRIADRGIREGVLRGLMGLDGSAGQDQKDADE